MRVATPKQRKSSLGRLAQAAAAISLIGAHTTAVAQNSPPQAEVRVAFAHYDEFQEGKQDRMRVEAPMAWMRAPAGERGSIEGSFVFDSMSGASPYYFSTLTGASGSVDDRRYAGDLKYTHHFERVAVGVGAAFSNEDDYQSQAGLMDARWWTEDRNTAITAGLSFADDDISSTLSQDFEEGRHTTGYAFGVEQVIDENSVVQSNVTMSSASGYMADPYKTFDYRPEGRDTFAFLQRYVRYFESADAALHADYRYFRDSWDIQSHTVELAWYQPILEKWMLRPSLRYYSQSDSEFYAKEYPPVDFESFYSADQRLGNFGAVSVGLKLTYEFDSKTEIGVSAEMQAQHTQWKLGGAPDTDVVPFYNWYVLTGITKRF